MDDIPYIHPVRIHLQSTYIIFMYETKARNRFTFNMQIFQIISNHFGHLEILFVVVVVLNGFQEFNSGTSVDKDLHYIQPLSELATKDIKGLT